MCVPETGPTPPGLARLPDEFFEAHILREQGDNDQGGGGSWFRCALAGRLPSLIVEGGGGGGGGGLLLLKLLSAPGYQPSFRRGLHTAQVKRVVFGVNKVSSNEM